MLKHDALNKLWKRNNMEYTRNDYNASADCDRILRISVKCIFQCQSVCTMYYIKPCKPNGLLKLNEIQKQNICNPCININHQTFIPFAHVVDHA